MATVTKPMALDETLQATNTAIGNVVSKLTEVKEALETVKSVNGKTGVVVLDGRDINMDESAATKTTIKNAVTALQTKAVTFDLTNIEGDDYLLTITQGT